MTSLEFILGAYITTAVIALVVYITRIVVEERKMEHQLAHAKKALESIAGGKEQLALDLDTIDGRLCYLERLLGDHESKLSKLTLAKGWTGQ